MVVWFFTSVRGPDGCVRSPLALSNRYLRHLVTLPTWRNHLYMGPQRTDSVSSTKLSATNLTRFRRLPFISGTFLIVVIAISACASHAQNPLPFEVSNPKNKKWSAAEASRIYAFACDLLTRTVRPEKPPQLHPKLLLVLGAGQDEFVRDQGTNEVRLKTWNPEMFAEAVVLGAVREVLRTDELQRGARESVSLADATVSSSELKGR